MHKRIEENTLVPAVPIDGVSDTDTDAERVEKIVSGAYLHLFPDASASTVKDICKCWHMPGKDEFKKCPEHLPLHVLGWAKEKSKKGTAFYPFIAVNHVEEGNKTVRFFRVVAHFHSIFNGAINLRKKSHAINTAMNRVSGVPGTNIPWENMMKENDLLFEVTRDGKKYKVPIFTSSIIRKSTADAQSARTKTTMAPPVNSHVTEVAHPIDNIPGLKRTIAMHFSDFCADSDEPFDSTPGSRAYMDIFEMASRASKEFVLPDANHGEKKEKKDKKRKANADAVEDVAAGKKTKKDVVSTKDENMGENKDLDKVKGGEKINQEEKKEAEKKSEKGEKVETAEKKEPKSSEPMPKDKKSKRTNVEIAGKKDDIADETHVAKAHRVTFASDNTLHVSLRAEGDLFKYIFGRCGDLNAQQKQQSFEKTRVQDLLDDIEKNEVHDWEGLVSTVEKYISAPIFVAIMNYLFVVSEKESTFNGNTFAFATDATPKCTEVAQTKYSGILKRVVRICWSSPAACFHTRLICQTTNLPGVTKAEADKIRQRLGDKPTLLLYALSIIGSGKMDEEEPKNDDDWF